MYKKIMGLLIIILIIMVTLTIGKKDSIKELEVTILKSENNYLTVQDQEQKIYNIPTIDEDILIGSNILLKYQGNLENMRVLSYITINNNTEDIPLEWLENGIFKNYYVKAFTKLQELSLDDKINQLLLVRYPKDNGQSLLEDKQFGGYVFYERDFKNKNKEEVSNIMNNLQKVANIPILTAVDEEGGDVVRISSNKQLSEEKFKSPQVLYQEGGLELIKEDTLKKSQLLKELGINLNLAPVVDISTNKSDYIYRRTLGLDALYTKEYAKTVINASKNTGVSYTLKHFPGYGNNIDTHLSSSVDNRSYADLLSNDLEPFIEGINEGAEAVMISHNIVNSIDPENPASLSLKIHELLRNDLHFTGIIITDDLAMGATKNIKDNGYKAIKAGNDLLITTNYQETFNSIKKALENNDLTMAEINQKVFKIIAWKYYKNLLTD